ncbi:hypothetical protein [Campylobacter pinnipediorum]|nr:hypothetical protein [Campylobacter pinnipediorum]
MECSLVENILNKILTINNFDKYKDEIDINIGNKTSKEADSDDQNI